MTASTHQGRLDDIARLLGVEATELHLDGVADADLTVLHTQIGDRLFADKRRRFARLAALSQTIPGPIAGKLAEKFLPPAGAALAAELLEPDKARDLVNRVSLRYLGDLAKVLDPVRAQRVIRAIPAERVGEVAKELFGRDEYAATAEFVGAVEVDVLFAALGAATPHDLLAVVPMLEWNDNLDRVIAELPPEQIQQIVDDLDAGELADLALAVEPHRFGGIVEAVPVDTVADIAGVFLDRGEYAAMLGFAGVITPQMLAAALAQASREHLDGLVAEVAAGHLWAEFDRLAGELDDAGRGRMITVLNDATAATFSALEAAWRAGRIGTPASELLSAAVDSRSESTR